MELPGNVSKSALLERVKRIREGAIDNKSVVPHRVMGCIEDCITMLDSDGANADKLYSAANKILVWYYDKGSKDIPLHVEMFNLTLSVVKMLDAQRSLVKIRKLLSEPDAPAAMSRIVDLLESLITAFGKDGRIDKRRYDDFAPRLRALAEANRSYLENHVDRVIFTV